LENDVPEEPVVAPTEAFGVDARGLNMASMIRNPAVRKKHESAQKLSPFKKGCAPGKTRSMKGRMATEAKEARIKTSTTRCIFQSDRVLVVIGKVHWAGGAKA
jgi:hypothetical protein